MPPSDRIYGLRLAAPWLPAESSPDLTIQVLDSDGAGFRDARKARPERHRNADFVHQKLEDGRRYVRWRQLIECIIDPTTNHVQVRALSSAGLETFRSHLLSPIVALALLDRGQEVLHGGAVSIGDRAVAILGGCGAGKSTLAAALLSTGGRCITDDLLVLPDHDGRHCVLPGPARLKLYPATAACLLRGDRASLPLNPFTTKRVYSLLASERETRTLPLAGFWVLGKGSRRGGMQARRLIGGEAVRALIGSTFVTIESAPDRQSRLLEFASALAGRVPVYSLILPRGVQRLVDQSASIARALAALAA